MSEPVLPSAGALRPLGLARVRLTRGFWADRQARNSTATIPHAREWLEKTGWLDNLRLAANGELTPYGRRGREFSDSEVYKLAEAMAWDIGRGADAAVDELSAVIAGAQEPGGYLNTMFGRPGQSPRYADLERGHELYCYGHLIQAGVARLRTGAQDALTAAAIRAADHVCVEFGETGRPGFCGHPGIEMALVELYRTTGVTRYLDQARLFVDRRGHATLPDHEFGRVYYQDDMPIRDRTAFAGHAVRALYLACGAVDVAVETGDDALLAAIVGQWERTVAARTHLTGGMGSRHNCESFGDDYELPPDRAYAETCAGIASVMLSWRLLLATGEARFADLAERTLYNVVATSTALDGRAFFYSNPLQQRVREAFPERGAPNPRASAGVRAPWFEVSCCPSNVARTLASIGGYLATTDADGIQVHQYAGAEIRTGEADLSVATDYPWHGSVRVRVERTSDRPWRLSLRVPSWAGTSTLVTPDGEDRVGPGYAAVTRRWRPGDEVRLELPVSPRWTRPDARVDALRGCVAVERGPLVYCAESMDSDEDPALDAIMVDSSGGVSERPLSASGPGVALDVRGVVAAAVDGGWPYGSPSRRRPEPRTVTLVPYHLWANRGPATMRVWLPDLQT